MDNLLVIELNEEELKYFNMIIDKFGYDCDNLIHKIFNWCFHSHYFWESIKKDKKLRYC